MVFFKLLPSDIFGGRVLVTKSEGQTHLPGDLAVIADSQEVEILLIDKKGSHLFPEDVQILLNEKLGAAFSPENPYGQEVMENIKNRFKEWDKFKTQTFLWTLF